jgi:hypothetical protein
MFESLSHDGVKRPGTREMTVMLAGLMALNARDRCDGARASGDWPVLHVMTENHRQLVVTPIFLARRPSWSGVRSPTAWAQADPCRELSLYCVFALLCASGPASRC